MSIKHDVKSLFLSGSEIKTGENILPSQYREIGNNFVECHASRQPSQHIENSDTGFPHTRLTEALVGIDSDNVVIILPVIPGIYIIVDTYYKCTRCGELNKSSYCIEHWENKK